MSVSAHDRISGTPQMVRAWDVSLRYALHSPLTVHAPEAAAASHPVERVGD